MAKNSSYTVQYRRKRAGKTSYKTRLKLVQSGKPRLVVRKSLKNILVQIVEFNSASDRVLFSACSKDLLKFGWKGSFSNTSAAYLTGYLLAKKAKKALECVADIGMNISVKGGVLYAAIKGAVDGGLKVPLSESVVPAEDRIKGVHISKFADSIKGDKERYGKQFSLYLKQGLAPEKLPEHFDQVKQKVGNEKGN